MNATRKTEIKRMMRKHRDRKARLRFLLQDVEDPVNVGSVFRIADAIGAEQVLLTGISARPPHPRIDRVGRGKDRRVPWAYVEDPAEAVRTVQNDGFEVLALEVEPDAQTYDAKVYAPCTCLVVGHEEFGISKTVRQAVDSVVYIPMHGKGASLNVHVALAVVAFHIHSAVGHLSSPGMHG